MAVRAGKAAATRSRILEVAQELFVADSADFTLEKIAAMAGVSVQTVLRAFGNKETLILEAIGTFRSTREPLLVDAPGSVSDAVSRLFDDYEEIGDRVIRMLAEEHRVPGFAAVAEVGRARHREWVEAAFAEQLKACPARESSRILVALLAATDVYVWKLLRRDFGLDRKQSEAAVGLLIRGASITEREK